MKSPLISIVTPVYNSEPYINQYLNGLLNQSYKNLEIICVNDGSPDNCGEILEDYAAKDSRIKIFHQINQGLNKATNIGLDNANGDYITFMDPDDWAEPDFYECVVDAFKREAPDIVITNYYRNYNDRCEKMVNLKSISPVFDSADEAFRYGFESDMYRGFKMYLWNKVFKNDFFKQKTSGGFELRMAHDLTIGADNLLLTECNLAASKFVYINEAFYHYRIRETSLMRSGEFSRRIGFLDALERISGMLEKRNFDKETVNLVKRFHTYYASQLAESAYRAENKNNFEFSKSQIRKFLEEYIESNARFPDRLKRIEDILKLALR